MSRQTGRKVEILAPAGSLESLYSAMKMGADAVYVGTSRFGARAFAKNPTVEELTEAITYAHLREKKIYLTTNTLLNDEEVEKELFPLIVPLYEAGLDACIVQDLGVLDFLHEYFPDMDLHASTQMTLFSGEEAELYRPYGVTRFVPARELRIEEIRQARAETDLEIEVFVHGALCYCYSGQCRMSEVMGGRSGNRGMCAQPCRLPFQTPNGTANYLSTKDICTLPYIPLLVDAGIDSFKIEGRMKRAEYSAYMAYLYRHYTDVYLEEGNDYYRELVENRDSTLWRDYRHSMDLYNRGGFSKSYLFEKDKANLLYDKRNGHFGVPVGKVISCEKKGDKVVAAAFLLQEDIHPQDVLEFRNQKEEQVYEYTVKDFAQKGQQTDTKVLPGSLIRPGQIVYRTKNAKLLQDISDRIECMEDKIELQGEVFGELGQPLRLKIRACGTDVTVMGDCVQQAAKRPVTEEDVRKRLDSLGNTKYRWESLSISFPEQAFVPLGGLKELRRKAIAAFEKNAVPRRETDEVRTKFDSEKQIEKNEIKDNCQKVLQNVISLSCYEQVQAAVFSAKKGTLFHLKLEDLPAQEWEKTMKLLSGLEYAVSFPRILRGKGKTVWKNDWKRYGDVFTKQCPKWLIVNSHAMYLLGKKWFPGVPMAAEENLYRENERAKKAYFRMELHELPAIVYGRIAVMVTEGCVPAKCTPDKPQILIQTPKKDRFVVVKHCHYCYNTIYTEQPERKKRKENVRRLDFTLESAEEVRKEIREWNF